MNINKLFISMVIALTLLPVVASADIYKWKDKDGVLRYTDTPPPYGVKTIEIIGKKATKFPTANPTMSAAPAKAAAPSGAPVSPSALTAEKATNNAGSASDVIAQDVEKKRRQMEEIERKNSAVKEAEAKQKALNCAAAKANYQSYSQGGRVYRTNEKGEREYMDDKGLAEGAAKAQQEISQYCS